jgi:hypothetical protein
MASRQRSKLDIDSGRPSRSVNWNTHAAVLLASIILFFGIIFAYAAPSAILALYRIIYDGSFLLLILAAATGFGCAILHLFTRPRPPSDLLTYVTATALGLGFIGLLTLLLGLIGFLNQAIAFALIALGLVALIARLYRTKPELRVIKSWWSQPAGSAWLYLLAVPPLAMMAVCAMLPPYLLWNPQEPHGYDVVEYHLQVPREWFEAGRIFPLHHNVFSYLPFNVEMHYLLAMHIRGGPWAGMYLAQFIHAAFVGLTVLATAAVAFRVTKNRTAAIVAALSTAGIPMLPQLGAIAYVEGGFLLFSVLCVGWVLIALREPDHRIRRFALAGVFAGLACGAKLTALPEVLCAVGFLLVLTFVFGRDWRMIAVSHWFALLSTFALCAVVTFAPWLIRTGLWATNPFFPEIPQLGRGPFSQVQAERWKRSLEPRPEQRSIAGRSRAAWTQILSNWQYAYLLVPGAVLALFLKSADPTARFLGAMFFLLCLFWLFFTHLQARFFVLAVPLCALLMAVAARPMLPVSIAVALIGAAALHVDMTMTRQRPWNEAVILLGNEVFWPQSELTPPAIKQVPEDAPVALVGEAKAFLYQIPMKRLRYRTVFDVDDSAGKSFLDAVAGPPEPDQVLVIDPNELRRFEKTYQPFPQVPPALLDHDETYILRR